MQESSASGEPPRIDGLGRDVDERGRPVSSVRPPNGAKAEAGVSSMAQRIARAVTALLVVAFSAAVAFAFGWWPTTMLLSLIGCLLVATAVSSGRFARLEWHLSSWLLTACVIAIGWVSFFAIAPEDFRWNPELTRTENEAEYYRITGNRADHSEGVVSLGWASLLAALVLATRRLRVHEPAAAGFWATLTLGVILLVLNALLLAWVGSLSHPDMYW